MCAILIYTIYLYYAFNGFLLRPEIAKMGPNGFAWLPRWFWDVFLYVQMSSFYLSPKQFCWMPWPEEFAMCSSKFVSSTHLCLCHANLVCHCWFAMHLHHLSVCTFAISQQFGKLHVMWFFTCCLGPTPPTLAYFLTKCSTLVVFHAS